MKIFPINQAWAVPAMMLVSALVATLVTYMALNTSRDGAMIIESKPMSTDTHATMTMQKAPNDMTEYELILSENLPKMMHVVFGHQEALRITAEQRKALDELMSDHPAKVMPIFAQSVELEKKLGQQIVQSGVAAEPLMDQLKQLSQWKLEATVIHIGCVQRLRQILSPEQYQQLLGLLPAEGKH